MAITSPPTTRRTASLRFLLVLALLYLFLVGVKLLETGIKELGADFTDGLFERVANPAAALLVGVLATVLVQSSSVTTATIVGLVGAGTLSISAAVPMVMGANIGTTVTNTLASLGHLRRSEELARAFSGATVHDFFNLLAVLVLFPLELSTRFLSRSAAAVADWLRPLLGAAGTPGSPIKDAVKAPVRLVEHMLDWTGVEGGLLGSLLLILGLVVIFLSLANITRKMRQLLAGRIERSMNTILGRGGGVAAMAVGLVITVLVQSSSITTSILVPMVAAGVLTLRNAYPVTLGANLGTTVTALLASLATESPAGLVVALAHSLFNVAGILIFYPVPQLRSIPIRLAEGLADLAVRNRSLIAAYVFGAFVAVPLVGILLLR